MKCYIGTKIVKATPAEKDDQEGYKVVYPDGYASWSPKKTFEENYREITQHERQVLDSTDAEAQISMISDGEADGLTVCERRGHHRHQYLVEVDKFICQDCGHDRDSGNPRI